MRKKIAYFTGTYPSLTETFVQREINFLGGEVFDITVFAIRRPHDLKPDTERSRKSENTIYGRPDRIIIGLWMQLRLGLTKPRRYLQCWSLILSQLREHSVPQVARLMAHLLAASAFVRDLNRLQIKHIHAHFETASTMALFCQILNDNTFSMAAHASADIYVNPVLLESKMHHAKVIVAENSYNRRFLDLVTDYQFSDRIEFVYNGVAISDAEAVENRPQIQNTDIVQIVSVGGLKYFKGFTTLIEALSIVKEKTATFHCSIVGDGPQRPVLETLIDQYGLREDVTMLGSMENAATLEIMKKADIFVLASEIYINGTRDGIPTVCTEAMSMKKPVISTYISGIPELIEDGKSGLLVPEKSPKKLAAALWTLIDDKNLRKEIGQNGYDKVRETFSITNTMAKLQSILDEIVD